MSSGRLLPPKPMLTARGGAMLLLTFALWAYGLIVGLIVLALVGSVLLLWFFYSWLSFLWRVRRAARFLRVQRGLFDQNGLVRQLWAGLPYRVQVRVQYDGLLGLPFAAALDRLPPLAALTRGNPHAAGTLSRDEDLVLNYTIKTHGAGLLRFEGVRLLVTDLEGFFAQPLFLRDLRIVRCLPPLADRRGHVPTVKRLNILPLLGQHPHRRPGSGIELLELRDYVPGDPPKRIAWKISARRDRLVTRELESEVPVRCTLFLDTSDAVRIGPAGRNALANLNELAAAAAQANAAARDLTGLVLFDEEKVGKVMRPERGRRHLVEMTRVLADHADLMPRANKVPLNRLIPLAFGVIQDIYPELLQAPLNRFPWWLPFWSPRPSYTLPVPGPRPISRLGRLAAWLGRRLRDGPLNLVLSLPRRFSISAHRQYRQRKQLVAVLGARNGWSPGAMAELLEDDDQCRRAILPFLIEHQVPFPLRHYDEEGRYAFASAAKVALLARALLGAVRRGRDNELFVLLADLLEIADLEPLLGAVRVARARHHQVLMVCAWPADVPLPGSTSPDSGSRMLHDFLQGNLQMEEVVQHTETWRLHQAFDRLKRELGRAGVMVLCARQGETTALILERMRQLRTRLRGGA